jgi:hypothetical protein
MDSTRAFASRLENAQTGFISKTVKLCGQSKAAKALIPQPRISEEMAVISRITLGLINPEQSKPPDVYGE